MCRRTGLEMAVVEATLDQRTSRDPHQGGCKRCVVGHRTHVLKIPSTSCALRIPREKEYGQISVDRKIQIKEKDFSSSCGAPTHSGDALCRSAWDPCGVAYWNCMRRCSRVVVSWLSRRCRHAVVVVASHRAVIGCHCCRHHYRRGRKQ